MSGGVYNVVVRNVHFRGSEFATRIKSARGRGGVVQNITFENLTFDNNVMGVAINMNYSHDDPAPPLDERTPHVKNIVYRNISGRALTAGVFEGLAESAVTDILLEDVNISAAVGGFECYRAKGGTAGNFVIPDACF